MNGDLDENADVNIDVDVDVCVDVLGMVMVMGCGLRWRCRWRVAREWTRAWARTRRTGKGTGAVYKRSACAPFTHIAAQSHAVAVTSALSNDGAGPKEKTPGHAKEDDFNGRRR